MHKMADQEQRLADRLVELSEWARAVGRTVQADRFLLLAWTAFEDGELPAWPCASQRRQANPAADASFPSASSYDGPPGGHRWTAMA